MSHDAYDTATEIMAQLDADNNRLQEENARLRAALEHAADTFEAARLAFARTDNRFQEMRDEAAKCRAALSPPEPKP